MMAQVKIQLPDGSTRGYDKGTTGFHIAESISPRLAKEAVVVKVGGVVLLQMAFRAVTDQGNAVAVVATTLAIAALFMPLRRGIQNAIDRRFYRHRYDTARTLAAFSETARDEVDLEKLAGELVAVVQDTMQPTRASLWLRKDERTGR